VTPWALAVDLESGDSASTLAMTMEGSFAKSRATCSQIGARDLQSGKDVRLVLPTS
jgi:hypothetical protein